MLFDDANPLVDQRVSPPPLPVRKAPAAASSDEAASAFPLPASPAPRAAAAPPLSSSGEAVTCGEPPVSLTARVSTPSRIRSWSYDRLLESPSWLTSLVVHMTIMVLVASLAVPVSNHRNVAPVLLVFSASEDERQEGDPVILLTNDSQPVEGGEGGELEKQPAPAPVETPQPLDEPAPAKPTEDLLALLTQPGKEAEEDQQIDKDPTSATPKPQAKQAPDPYQVAGFTSSAPDLPQHSAQAAAELRAKTIDAAHWADDAVDRFIDYDIGNLPGAAGERARQEFLALGPEAIPALVRGLNKSAYIRASCPVGVISHKLKESLKQTDDPVMIAYALENIGRDVKPSAPHAARVHALRDRLAHQLFGDRDMLRARLLADGVEPTDRLVEMLKQFQRATADQCIEALKSDDLESRLAATYTLSKWKFNGVPVSERMDLSLAMIDGLKSDHPDLVEYTRQSLSRMAEGVNYGPAAGASPAARELSAERWRRHWETVVKATVDKKVQAKFNRAVALERNGRRQPAVRYFREIIAEHPDSHWAMRAGARLQMILLE